MNNREKMLALVADMRRDADKHCGDQSGAWACGKLDGYAHVLEALLTEPTLEEVLALLNNITLNATLVSLDGATDIYAVPLDDIEAAQECLRRVKG